MRTQTDTVLAQRHPHRLGDGEGVASCRRPVDTGRPNLALPKALRALAMACSQGRRRRKLQRVRLGLPSLNGDRRLGWVLLRCLQLLPPVCRLRRHLTSVLQFGLRTLVPAPQLNLRTSKLASRSLLAVVGVAAQSFPLLFPTVQQTGSTR